MFRYRINFAQEGSARFISHLDTLRVFERSARRGGLPLAFSGGFNPHPRLNFAVPLPVGIAGVDEYVDVELTRELPAGEVAVRLQNSLPRGFKILRVKALAGRGRPLMALVSRATYLARGDAVPGLLEEDLTAAAADILNSPSLIVEKKTRSGRKTVDIRRGILSLKARLEGQGPVLEMELRTGGTENVRPEEVLGLLSSRLPGKFPDPRDFHVVRTGLYAEGPGGPVSLMDV